MNKNGFTLIELLGVIIIFAMLVTVLVISSDSVVRNSKKQLSDTQIENIEKAANLYYLKEGTNNSYNNRSFKLCVNLSYLIDNDYIEDEEIINPKNNEKMVGSVEITYDLDQYTYKYKENNCTYEYQAIDEICKAVTEETKTTGNVPSGKYLPGDEYICEVKDNTKYHFFVLSTEDNNVNLIMDRNLYYDEENDVGMVATETNKGLVAWNIDLLNNNVGPVTAMTYLHNATKDWINIPNIKINYKDENIMYESSFPSSGFGGIKTIENTTIITSKSGEETLVIENLKTRMPSYEEMHGKGNCPTGLEDGSCSIWLINYLNPTIAPGEGLQNISRIEGYWILSSGADTQLDAWAVHYASYLDVFSVYYDDLYGIRPVISIPKLDIAN